MATKIVLILIIVILLMNYKIILKSEKSVIHQLPIEYIFFNWRLNIWEKEKTVKITR